MGDREKEPWLEVVHSTDFSHLLNAMQCWEGSGSSPFLPPAKFLTGDVSALLHQPICVLRTHGPEGAIHHLGSNSFGFCLP